MSTSGLNPTTSKALINEQTEQTNKPSWATNGVFYKTSKLLKGPKL